ncbi:MAG TPA: hypothetical protein VF406_21510 [Thermodesulfobacteriota bacterium]
MRALLLLAMLPLVTGCATTRWNALQADLTTWWASCHAEAPAATTALARERYCVDGARARWHAAGVTIPTDVAAFYAFRLATAEAVDHGRLTPLDADARIADYRRRLADAWDARQARERPRRVDCTTRVVGGVAYTDCQ